MSVEADLASHAASIHAIGAEQDRADASRSKIIERLDTLVESSVITRTWAASIDKRLDLLNGSVARHEQRLGAVENTAQIEAAVAKASAAAQKTESAKYQRWLVPIVKYLLMAFVALLLEHGPAVVKVMGK